MAPSMATHVPQDFQRRLRRINTMHTLPKVVLPTSESIPTSYAPPGRFHPILSAISSVESIITASTDEEDRHTAMNIVPPLHASHAQTQSNISITDSIHLVDSSNLPSSFDDLFGQRDIEHRASIPSTHAATDTLKPSIHKVGTPSSDTAMAPSDAAARSPLDVSDNGARISMADNVTNAASAPSPVHGRSTRRVVVVLNGDSSAIYPTLEAAVSALTPGAQAYIFWTMAEARKKMNRIFRQSQPVPSIPASHRPDPPPPSPRSYSSSVSADNDTGDDTSFKTGSTSGSSRRTGDSITFKFSTNGKSARAAGPSFHFTYGYGATADSHILLPPLKINTFIPATEDDVFDFEQFINTLNPRSRFVSQSRHCYYAIARGRVRTIVGTFEEMYLLTRRLPFEPVVQGFFSFDAAKAWILAH